MWASTEAAIGQAVIKVCLHLQFLLYYFHNITFFIIITYLSLQNIYKFELFF